MAKRAKVGQSTLKDFETGKRVPIRNNLGALRSALEAAGIGLIFDEADRPHGITAAITQEKDG